jgi:gluconolactonase
MRFAAIGTALAIAAASILHAQQPAAINLPAAPDIAAVIKGGTRPVLIATGLQGADDPIWLPGTGLVFSEPRANRVVRLSGDDKLTTFVEGLRSPLGMTLDRSGRLISLQSEDGHTGARVIWPAGKETVVADRFLRQPFSRPNDIVSDSKGGIYFSDPGLNAAQEQELRKAHGGAPLAPRLPPSVYYVPSGGTPIRVAEGIARPNGVQLSRDERVLYVSDTNGINALAFDILPDGTLSNRRTFATYAGRVANAPAGSPASGGDGIAIDSEGRVYTITEAGIEILTLSGRPVGIIPVSCSATGARCQGLAFGGPDKRTLYVAGQGTLLKIQMLAQGFGGRAK